MIIHLDLQVAERIGVTEAILSSYILLEIYELASRDTSPNNKAAS